MTKRAASFLSRNGVELMEVMYLKRDGGKTVLVMENGKNIETYIPLKALVEEFPSNTFQLVNKGIALNSRYIANIYGRSFVMSDGSTFEGRLRGSMLTSPQNVVAPQVKNERRGISSRFSALDNQPLAFCVVQIDTRDEESPENDIEQDFSSRENKVYVRYCNEAMARLLGVNERKALGQSLDRLLKSALGKGRLSNVSFEPVLDAVVEVALTGTQRVVDFGRLRVYCSRPQDSYCAIAICVI